MSTRKKSTKPRPKNAPKAKAGEGASLALPYGHTRARGRKKIWEDAFLLVLRKSGNVTEACALSNVSRTVAYEKRKADPKFEEAWKDAVEAVTDKLEQEAIRRAYKGVEKGIYYKGVRVATEHEYSDQLLMFLLKKMRPDYRDSFQPQAEAEQPKQINWVIQVNTEKEQEKKDERKK